MEWTDATVMPANHPGGTAGEEPPTIDLTFLALRDACQNDEAPSQHLPALASETPMFASILRAVLLQQQGKEERDKQLGDLAHATPGVFPVLTRLLAADEALAGCSAARVDVSNPSSSSTAGAAGLLLRQQQSDSLPPTASAAVGSHEVDHRLTARVMAPSKIASISNLADVQQKLLPANTPRRVCQYAFLKNDIVWICKNCQADETCVLCNDCFRSSDHEGHEVYFYHAQAGGCCDCGDPDAWDSRGFCDHHGLDNRDPIQELPRGLITAGSKVMGAVQTFLLEAADAVVRSFDLGEPWKLEGGRLPKTLSVMVHQSIHQENHLSEALASVANIGVSKIHQIRYLLESGKAEEAELLRFPVSPFSAAFSAGDAGAGVDVGVDDAGDAGDGVQGGSADHDGGSGGGGSGGGQGEISLDGEKAQADMREMERLVGIARDLSERGLLISVRTDEVEARLKRALDVVRWLHAVSALSDGCCRLVCELLDVPTLVRLMEADAHLPKALACAVHDLYLALMADQPFKTRIAAAYVQALPKVTANYSRGIGTAEYALYTLSVQFLNRSAFVKELVEKHHLLQILSGCLVSTLAPACRRQSVAGGAPGNQDGKLVLVASHSVLAHRRYNPIVADLKCVLNIEGVPQRFLKACFTEWTKILVMVQHMAPQVRQQRMHVEREERDWMFAFNVNISLTSLFECMLGWLREPVGNASIPAGFFSSKTPPSSSSSSSSTQPLPPEFDSEGKNLRIADSGDVGPSSVPPVAPLPAGMIRQPSMPSPPPPPPKVLQPFSSPPPAPRSSTGGAGEEDGGGGGGGARRAVDSSLDAAATASSSSSPVPPPLALFQVAFRMLAVAYQASRVRPRRRRSPKRPAPAADPTGGAGAAAAGAAGGTEGGSAAATGGGVSIPPGETTLQPPPTDPHEQQQQHMMEVGWDGIEDEVFGDGVAAAAAGGEEEEEEEEEEGGEEAPLHWAGPGANAAMSSFLASHTVGEAPEAPTTGAAAAAAAGAAAGTRTVAGGRGSTAWEHQALPMYPRDVLRVRPPSAGRSFHIILHRFFSAMVRESCNCEERESDLRALASLVATHPEVATDVADTALNVLSFAAEVRAGLWRKNGQCMNDQVLNYAEPNFCKIFRDLDLVAVQFAGLSCGAPELVNHVLHKFQCFYWIFDEYNFQTPLAASSKGKSASASASAASSSTSTSPTSAGGAAPAVPAAAGTVPPDASGVTGESSNKRRGGEQGGSGESAAAAAGVTPAGGGGAGSSPVPPTNIFSDPSAAHGMSGGGAGGEGGGRTGSEEGWRRRIRRRSMLDADQQLALGEECLLLLILLVTEMPVVPDPLDREPSNSDAGIEEHKWSGEGGGGGGGSGGGRPSEITEKTGGGMDSRLARQLRRELVHRLASAPCTHSELQDTCYATSHNETLEAELMEAVLRDVATRREPANALEAGKFVLKPEVFAAEYDCTFFHQSLQAHQQASERRPPIKGPTPVAPPPPEAHPMFKQLRVDLLKSEAMVRVVGQVLLGCSRKCPGRWRDTLLLRGLHLLTLAVHAVHPSSTSTPPCGGAAAAETGKGKGKGKGAGLGDDESGTSGIDGSHTSDAEAFCIAMTAPIVRPPLPPIPAAGVPVGGVRGDGDAERGTANATASTPHFWGELDDVFSTLSSAGGAVGAAFTSSPEMDSIARAAMTAAKAASAPVVSVLQLLLELDAVPWDQNDKLISCGVKWLLTRLSEMSERCREIVAPKPPPSSAAATATMPSTPARGGAATGGGGGSVVGASPTFDKSAAMEERKKAARKRAMDMIEQKASTFAKQMALLGSSSSSSSSSSGEEEEDEEGTGIFDGAGSHGRGGGRDRRRGRAASGASSTAGGDGDVAGPEGAAPAAGAAARASGKGKRTRAKHRQKRKEQKQQLRREAQPECIVCRDKGDGGTLGFVGFGRRSLVLDVRPDGQRRCPGVHLQFCGHAMHYSCFDQYYATVVQISDSHNDVALDVKRGEFHCPLCKAVGNLMVPYFVPSDEESDSDYSDEGEEAGGEEEKFGTLMDVEIETQSGSTLEGDGTPLLGGTAGKGGSGLDVGGGTGTAPAGDAMDVSEGEHHPGNSSGGGGGGGGGAAAAAGIPSVSGHAGSVAVGGNLGGCWVETKAALSLEMARPSVFAARAAAAAAAAAASGAGQLAIRTGSRFGLLAMDGNTDDDADEEDDQNVEAAAEQPAQREQEQRQQQEQEQQRFDPATKRFLESVYEVETALTAVPPSISPEALFLCACRALAYSVSSAAAATSPLVSLRGHAAAAAAAAVAASGSGLGAGAAAGGAIDHGDATRLRCLRLVAGALRKAAGQAGLEKTVRRKLAESLRGKAKGTSLLPSSVRATLHAGTDAAMDASERGPAEEGPGEASAAATTAPPAAAADADADAAAAATGAGGGEVDIVEVLLASAAATLESAEQQLGQFDPGVRAAVELQGKEEQLEDLDKPLVLTGAMEMLGTALVVLPPGDARGARHSVGALCMVRALQVLSVPRFEEQQDKLKLLEVESLFFDGDSGDAQGRGELVAAGARAGGGDGGESHSPAGLEGPAATARAAAPATSGGGSCRRIVPRDHHFMFWGGDNSGGDDGGSGGDDPLQLPGGRRAAAERVRTFSVQADDYSADKAEDEGVGKLPPPTAMTAALGGEKTGDAATGCGGGGGGDRYVRLAGAHVTAFLRTALLMVHVCMETPPLPPPPRGAGAENVVEGAGVPSAPGPAWADGGAACLPSADDKLSPLCRFFGFPTSAEALMAEPGLVDAARRWLACVADPAAFRLASSLPTAVAAAAAETFRSRSHMSTADWVLLSRRREVVSRRLFDFPSPLEIELVRLPHAYTELHAQVSTHNNISGSNSGESGAAGAAGADRVGHPAVCLVCGEVLDASGRGACTRHARDCGSGLGLLFLLQECAVLLIHGRRAAYFPSPYVDAYGERQRHTFRGRPLFLDQRRYNVVRGLWVKHLVAHEVVQNRSTSRQVIITNHY